MIRLEALPQPDTDLNGRLGYVLRYLGPGFRAEEGEAFSISGAGCCKWCPRDAQKTGGKKHNKHVSHGVTSFTRGPKEPCCPQIDVVFVDMDMEWVGGGRGWINHPACRTDYGVPVGSQFPGWAWWSGGEGGAGVPPD